MAWVVDIHTIDVGQGESSLLHAYDLVAGADRRILIDGGHPVYAQIVHNYLLAAGIVGVDRIMVTHYDADHSGGIMALLTADNLWHACDAIATVAAPLAFGATRARQVAATAAAVAAAAWGAFGPNAGQAGVPAAAARLGVAGGATDAVAGTYGVTTAVNLGPYGAALMFPSAGTRVSTAARAAAVVAANQIALGNVGAALVPFIRNQLLASFSTGVPPESRFDTGGVYGNVTVIDIGNTAHMPAQYANIVGGGFLLGGNFNVQAPGTNRVRGTPALGTELLFNPAVPPAGAPAAVVVACLALAWQGVGNAPVAVVSGQPDNDDSIAVIVRFDSFAFYTGGDLPYQGENPIAAAATALGLPNPGGGTYPVLPDIPYGKCGHHGANTSTRQAYLNAAQPAGAVISAGSNPAFQHPDAAVINRLHNQPSMDLFYMTNCNFQTPNVAASNGLNQLTTPGNIARVSGDNNPLNRTPGRNRGDVRLRITQANAVAAVAQYAVRYWEDDLAPPNFRTEPTNY
jgi:beta-lactamase superfamily II metal-dependent hydrolase